MHLKHIASLLLATSLISGCAMHTTQGKEVYVVDKVAPECVNLGSINSSITYWGLTSELETRLKNKAAKQGGNTVLKTGDASGFAYSCPN